MVIVTPHIQKKYKKYRFSEVGVPTTELTTDYQSTYDPLVESIDKPADSQFQVTNDGWLVRLSVDLRSVGGLHRLINLLPVLSRK